jgi:hypothetical protein
MIPDPKAQFFDTLKISGVSVPAHFVRFPRRRLERPWRFQSSVITMGPQHISQSTRNQPLEQGTRAYKPVARFFVGGPNCAVSMAPIE